MAFCSFTALDSRGKNDRSILPLHSAPCKYQLGQVRNWGRGSVHTAVVSLQPLLLLQIFLGLLGKGIRCRKPGKRALGLSLIVVPQDESISKPLPLVQPLPFLVAQGLHPPHPHPHHPGPTGRHGVVLRVSVSLTRGSTPQ